MGKKLVALLSGLFLAAGIVSGADDPVKPPVIADTGCFQPLTYRGKPFFLLGNWDSRNENTFNALDLFLRGAGMNTFIIGVNLQDEKTYRENLDTFRWFRDNHPEIAIIIELQMPFVTK